MAAHLEGQSSQAGIERRFGFAMCGHASKEEGDGYQTSPLEDLAEDTQAAPLRESHVGGGLEYASPTRILDTIQGMLRGLRDMTVLGNDCDTIRGWGVTRA